MATFIKIASSTVGSGGVASVTFSGIPQTGYTDLVVKYSGRANDNGISDGLAIRFNGTTTGYSGVRLGGNGSTTENVSGTGDRFLGINGTASTASTFTNGEIYIPNYTSSNNKSYSTDYVLENNATAAFMAIAGVTWANTAAITSITLIDDGKDLLQHSTFYLYGIKKN